MFWAFRIPLPKLGHPLIRGTVPLKTNWDTILGRSNPAPLLGLSQCPSSPTHKHTAVHARAYTQAHRHAHTRICVRKSLIHWDTGPKPALARCPTQWPSIFGTGTLGQKRLLSHVFPVKTVHDHLPRSNLNPIDHSLALANPPADENKTTDAPGRSALPVLAHDGVTIQAA